MPVVQQALMTAWRFSSVHSDVSVGCVGDWGHMCKRQCFYKVQGDTSVLKSELKWVLKMVLRSWSTRSSLARLHALRNVISIFGREIWKTIRHLSDASSWTPTTASFEYLGFDIYSALSWYQHHFTDAAAIQSNEVASSILLLLISV